MFAQILVLIQEKGLGMEMLWWVRSLLLCWTICIFLTCERNMLVSCYDLWVFLLLLGK